MTAGTQEAVALFRARAGDVCVLSLAPAACLSSARVRAELLEHLDALAADPLCRAIVVTGGDGGLPASDGALEPPTLAATALQIERLAKPVVFALAGEQEGAGLELALAAAGRSADAGARLSLRHLRLGRLPESGATQRAARLIGAAAALDLWLKGEPLDAARAMALGLLDRVASCAQLPATIAFARELAAAGRTPVGLRAVRDSEHVSPAELIARARARARRPAAAELLAEALGTALTLDYASGLEREAALAASCNASAESRALTALFFAERRAGTLAPGRALPVTRIAVVGAGTMGAGIATACLEAALEVILIDTDSSSLERGLARVRDSLESAVKKGRMSAQEAAASRARLSGATELGAAHAAELCIEAVFENLAAKRQVFGALDRIAPAALLASNTSYLSIDELARATGRPEQVLGLHFFSPANVMRLVEVVRGGKTAEDTLRTGVAFARRLGKLAVLATDRVGFIGNRMLQSYGNESQLLLLEGATPATVDAALEGFGFAMGPCAVFDLAGLDVGYRARRERSDLPNDVRYFRVCDLLVEAGRLGQKTGAGHYRYEGDARVRSVDPTVEALIAAEAARLAIARRAIDAEEIVARCVYALVNAGALILEEGIAERASDIDVVWTNGYGFPRSRGGPMYYADNQGLPRVVTALRELETRFGSQFAPAPLLLRLALQGRSLASLDR